MNSQKMNHVMLDLETLGNTSNSAIISVGAVLFDPKSGQLGAEFYQVVDVESAMEYGTVDGSTLKWWMNQSDSAREIFNDSTASGLAMVLYEFSNWLLTNCDNIDHNTAKVNVWGNGATFDNVILSNAYENTAQPKPWQYWGDKDVRTLVGLGRTLCNFDPKRDMPFMGTEHNALDDAKHQARYISAIFQQFSALAEKGASNE